MLWGSTFSLTIIAVSDGTHALALVSVQVIITSLLFALFGRFTGVPLFRLGYLKIYAVIALIGILLPNTLYFSAAPHLPAGILSITISTVPMLTYGLMWVLGFEPWALKRALGILFGMTAILFLVIPDQGFASASASFWIIAVLICAVCYAFENIFIDEWLPAEVDVRELLCGSNVVAALILTPILLFQNNFVPISWVGSVPFWAVAGAALSSTIAYAIYFHTIRISGAVFSSQCAYIITISGVIWGIVLFGESHSLWVWVSVTIMLVGLFLVTPRERSSEISPDKSIDVPIKQTENI